MGITKSVFGVTKDGKPAKGKVEVSEDVREAASKKVQELLSKFVLYPELDLDFLKKEFVKGERVYVPRVLNDLFKKEI